MTFLKRSTYIEMNKNNKEAYKTIANFAQSEGMYYHKKSAEVRQPSFVFPQPRKLKRWVFDNNEAKKSKDSKKN
jgi:hypothetical protein